MLFVFTELLETSLRRSVGTSSMFSSKSLAPCSLATRGKWTKPPCWKRSSDSCRNTTVKVTPLPGSGRPTHTMWWWFHASAQPGFSCRSPGSSLTAHLQQAGERTDPSSTALFARAQGHLPGSPQDIHHESILIKYPWEHLDAQVLTCSPPWSHCAGFFILLCHWSSTLVF